MSIYYYFLFFFFFFYFFLFQFEDAKSIGILLGTNSYGGLETHSTNGWALSLSIGLIIHVAVAWIDAAATYWFSAGSELSQPERLRVPLNKNELHANIRIMTGPDRLPGLIGPKVRRAAIHLHGAFSNQ